MRAHVDTGSDISFRGKGNAPKLYPAVLLDAYLEQLVSEIAVLYKLVKNQCEKLTLQVEIQPKRSVDAHKACMQANVRVFSGRPRFRPLARESRCCCSLRRSSLLQEWFA